MKEIYSSLHRGTFVKKRVLTTLLLLVGISAAQTRSPRAATSKPETPHLRFVKEYVRELTGRHEELGVLTFNQLLNEFAFHDLGAHSAGDRVVPRPRVLSQHGRVPNLLQNKSITPTTVQSPPQLGAEKQALPCM
jgi:hypothetical protein